MIERRVVVTDRQAARRHLATYQALELRLRYIMEAAVQASESPAGKEAIARHDQPLQAAAKRGLVQLERLERAGYAPEYLPK